MLGQRRPSVSPPWFASYHPLAHLGEGSLNSPTAAWAARMWGRGGAAMEVFIFPVHRPAWGLGALSDFPGSLLCPCIYRERGGAGSLGSRDQNAFLGCIVDNTLFLNKREGGWEGNRKKGRGWHAASPAAHWTQAKGGASLWRILPRERSLNPLIRMFSLRFTPFKGTGSLLSGCSHMWAWSCDSSHRILTLDSVCFTSTSDPLKTLRWVYFQKTCPEPYCSSPSSLSHLVQASLVSHQDSCKNLPMCLLPLPLLLLSSFSTLQLGDPFRIYISQINPI